MNDLTIIGTLTREPYIHEGTSSHEPYRIDVAIDPSRPSDKTTSMTILASQNNNQEIINLKQGDTCIFGCKVNIRSYLDNTGSRRKAFEPVIQELQHVGQDARMTTKQWAQYIGRLTTDPIREGKRVRFSIAINDKNNRDVEFIECISFEPQATVIEKDVYKSMQVIVEGRFEIDNYETRDGKTADSIRLLLDQKGLNIGWQKENKTTGTTVAPTPPPVQTSYQEVKSNPDVTNETRVVVPVEALTKNVVTSYETVPEWVTSDLQDVISDRPKTTIRAAASTAQAAVKPSTPITMAPEKVKPVFEAVEIDYLDPMSELPF